MKKKIKFHVRGEFVKSAGRRKKRREEFSTHIEVNAYSKST